MTEQFWPGPLTLILNTTDKNLKNSLHVEKIAIRVPNHDCTLSVLEECNFLIGTSANISGNTSYTDPEKCLKEMNNYDVFIDGGTIESKGESTIVEVDNEEIKIIREGVLKKERIFEV